MSKLICSYINESKKIIMANFNLRTIPNFSRYLISDSGEIYRTVKTTNGNIILQRLELHKCYNNYVNVWLYSDDNKKVCM